MEKEIYPQYRRRAGFTLIELLIVMAVFSIVLIAANTAFITILTNSTTLTKSAESYIEGAIGLEVFRHDLVQTGFGLPWSFSEPIAYNEAGNAACFSVGWNYNESANTVPRALIAADDLVTPNLAARPDYLVLKGTTLGLNETSQRWTHVSQGQIPYLWPEASENPVDNSFVIALRRTYKDTGLVNELVVKAGAGASEFSAPFTSTAAMPSGFDPSDPGVLHYLYGISPGQPRMPFNRADYYVRRAPVMPATCAPNTGVLYKSVIRQDDALGGSTDVPLLDCVADMQIVLGWNFGSPDGTGEIDTFTSPDGTNISKISGVGAVDQQSVRAVLDDPAELRARLKVIKVYVLAQDGLMQRSFSNTQNIVVGGDGEASLTHTYTPADIQANGWNNYRWRLYRLIVTPLNLGQAGNFKQAL